MVDSINNVLVSISGFMYQPWFIPLLLVVGGVWFTVRLKFPQFRLFTETFRVIMEKPQSDEGISSFGAMMMSTASRVGTGNIIGVSSAICMGGPGAIFWMWLMAIFGGASAFVESTLAQIYKKKNPDGTSYGGPAFYMETALGQRWLGVIFSILIIAIYAVGYNLLASYNLQSTFSAFEFYGNSTPAIIGLILAVLFGIIVIGGAKRLSKVTEVLVPIMGVIYILVAIFVIIKNYANIGTMFGWIFAGAFDFEAIFGGFAGSCIIYGLKRGLYSNEAGMGSAPNAAATADVSHPAKQGLIQMLSVFIDTLLICTCTAFMCMSSGIFPTPARDGAPYVQETMTASLGTMGPVFISLAMSLFAFTTLIGNYSYCEGCLKFVLKREPSKNGLLLFRVFATIIVGVGAVLSASIVWNVADVLQGLAVIINVPVILILGNKAFKCLDDYCEQKKQGVNPVFKAKNIGMEDELDYWQ